MFCVNCGEKLNEGEMVCHKCGASQVPASGQSPVNNQVNNDVQPVNTEMNNPEPVQNTVSQPVNNAPVSPAPAANPTVANVPANNAVTPQTNKGGNKWLVPVLIVIIVALAGVLVWFMMSKNNESGNSGVGGRDVETPSTPSGGSTVAVEDTIDYSGYKFQKVAGYSYQIDSGSLLVTDETTFATALIVENVSWSQVREALLDQATVSSLLSQSGFDSVTNPKVENYGGKEFVTYEVGQGTEKGIYYFTDLDGTYMSEGFVINPNYTVDYSTMNNVATVFNGVSANTYANSFGVTNNSKGFDYFKNNKD